MSDLEIKPLNQQGRNQDGGDNKRTLLTLVKFQNY